jgi:hypothetical protein
MSNFVESWRHASELWIFQWLPAFCGLPEEWMDSSYSDA